MTRLTRSRRQAGSLVSSIRAIVGAGGTAMLVGPAGIGKSWLLERSIDTADRTTVNCLAAFSHQRFRPLSHAFGTPFVGSPDEVAGDVLAALDGHTLAVEDLHWADPGTLAVVRALVGRAPIVATSRSHGSLGEQQRVEELVVPSLDEAEATAVVRRLHPQLDPDRVHEVVTAAAGNPLLLRHLAHGGTVSTTFRAAVADRIGGLRPELVDELGRLALRGAPVPATDVGLDEAAARGIVGAAADGTVWFSHDLFREAVGGALSKERRERLRRDLVQELTPAEAAPHLLALGERDRAARAALTGAAGADPTARAELLALAVDALAPGAPNRTLLDAAAAAIDAHQPDDARRFAREVHGDRDDEAEAALHLARADWLDGDVDAAAATIGAALLEVAGDGSDIEARLAVERAFIAVRSRVGDPTIVQLADAAVTLAEQRGVDHARALNVAGLARSHTGRTGWRELFDTAHDVARRSGDDEEELASRYWLVSALGFYGPMAEAISLGSELVAVTRQRRARRWYHHFLGALIVHLSARGDVPDDRVTEARRLIDEAPLFRNRAQVELALASALVDRDELAACERLIDAGLLVARGGEDVALLACAQAELALARRDLDSMRSALTAIVESDAAFFGLNAIAELAAIHLAFAHPGELVPPSTVTTLTPTLDVVAIEREAHQQQLDGDIAGAIRTCRIAATRWDERGLHRFARRARLAQAEVAAASGDIEQAVRLLDVVPRAGDLTERRCAALADQITRSLARATVTERELEVLGLVGAGLTSRQIGARLGISASTVDSHVVAAMRRLGARTRIQAATLVGTTPDGSDPSGRRGSVGRRRHPSGDRSGGG